VTGYETDVGRQNDLSHGGLGSAAAETPSSGATAGDALTLTLDATPENAATARHAIADVATRAGLDRETVAKAKLVVSEAFSNAALHAYPESGEGVIEVVAYPDAAGITVVVRDHGAGMRPRPASGRSSERLGLVLIAALAQSTRLRQLPGGGTELRADIFVGSGTC
jgi:anti-sigma regulatory factor (Ser/Thr protein kinase)